MTKTNSKKALLSSVFALVLSAAMLIGTTFAWFTDTASTAVNKIQAGNLDVRLLAEDGVTSLEGKTLNWQKAAGKADEEVLWEPGCTYKLEPIVIKNAGNLALKYKVVITGINGSAKLNEAIEWTFSNAEGNVDINAEGHLKAGESTKALTIQGHMKENAGNEYQGLSIDGIGITVYATQDTVESDSFNDQYDKNATYYPVIDMKGLNNALNIGGDVTVDADVTVYDTDTNMWRTMVDKPTTLTLNKKIISPDNMGDNDYNYAALFINADTTINAGTDGGIDTGKNGAYCLTVKSGTLTINGGYYYGGGTAVQVEKGELIINGGTFACEPYSNPAYGNKFLINCIDKAYKDGSAKVSIKGGTFINFDPSDSASENPHGNFVADGYSVISETKENGDVWYTVVKGKGATAGTQDELNTAVNGNSEVTVKLTKAGTYNLENCNMGSKNITIIGTKDTVIDIPTAIQPHNAKITMEGVTVKSPNANYTGLQHTAAITFKNCSVEGHPFLYATDAQFIGCTFTQTSKDAYNVWTYGSKTVLFKDCTFNCAGKSVLIYNEGSTDSQTVEFQNCKFNASAPVAGKAAIEIDSTFTSYNVIIDKATAENVNGFDNGSVSGNSVWNVKKQNKSTIVTVDGKTVYSK